MAKKRTAPPSPDRNLATGQFPGMNRSFYQPVGPHHYLLGRLRGVVLQVVGHEQLPESFDREFTVEDLTIKWPFDADEDDTKEREAFLTSESIVLLHHTAEAFVRLFLAHRGKPPCPWLKAAGLRNNFASHLKRLGTDLKEPASSEDLMEVFAGSRTRPEDNPMPEDAWTDMAAGLRLLMQHAVRLLTDDVRLYNAAKHGLAILPGAASMAFGDQDSPYAVNASGPSVTHLETGRTSAGEQWMSKTTWVHPQMNLTLVSLMCRQIGNLWEVATARYVESGTLKIWPMPVEHVRAVLRGGKPAGTGGVVSVPNMSMTLLYRQPPQKR